MGDHSDHDCGVEGCEGYSPEQEAFFEYWLRVLERVVDPDKFVLRVSSKKEVDDYVNQKLNQSKNRKRLGLPTPGLCESCQFIQGMCPEPQMNRLAGKSKPLPKVLSCPDYLPGEKLERPPEIPFEQRVSIIRHVEVKIIKGKEWVFVTGASWNQKTNQYELTTRGMEREKLDRMKDA